MEEGHPPAAPYVEGLFGPDGGLFCYQRFGGCHNYCRERYESADGLLWCRAWWNRLYAPIGERVWSRSRHRRHDGYLPTLCGHRGLSVDGSPLFEEVFPENRPPRDRREEDSEKGASGEGQNGLRRQGG